jgi:hypothetical protein
MAAPHALRIHSCVGTTTKGTPQTRFLALRPGFTPAFLEVLFLGRAPTPGRFELGRIWNGSWIGIGRRDEIQWVQKPVFVLRHDIVCETLEYFSTPGKFVNGGWRNTVFGSEGEGSMGYMIWAESLRDKRDLEVEAEKACEEGAGSIELGTG